MAFVAWKCRRAATSLPARLFEICRRGPARQGAHALHQRRPLGCRNDPPSVHQVEQVRALQAVVVGREDGIAGAGLGERPNRITGCRDPIGLAAAKALVTNVELDRTWQISGDFTPSDQL